MNANLAVVGLILGLLVFANRARAQTDAPPTAADIRREIAELKELLQAATMRLEALERRLDHTGNDRDVQFQEWKHGERDDSYLRFPVDVERAMMAPPSYRPRNMERFKFQPNMSGGGFEEAPPHADILPVPESLRLLEVPKLRP